MLFPLASRHFPTFYRLLVAFAAAWRWFRTWRRAMVRGVLVIVIVLGALFGLREYLVHTQRDAVAAIKRVRGVVYYDWEWPKGGLSWKGAADLRARVVAGPSASLAWMAG